MKTRASYDFYLILATTLVLAGISAVCIWGMFSFKLAAIHLQEAGVKTAWMERMNSVIAPLVITLIVLLGICVPKRLLPTGWLNRFAAVLVAVTLPTAWLTGIKTALLMILVVALILQLVVLVMAIRGSDYLNFTKKNYWSRLGSSAIHLGLVLFILDLYFYRHQTLHLALFWVTTLATIGGLVASFYAESLVSLFSHRAPSQPERPKKHSRSTAAGPHTPMTLR